MATPKIGDTEFMFLFGSVDEHEMALELIPRPGIDGEAAAELGKRASQSLLTTWSDHTSAANADTAYDAYKALIGGEPVTITYSSGQTVANVLLLGCERQGQPKQMAATTGSALRNAGTWILRCRWTVLHRGN